MAHIGLPAEQGSNQETSRTWQLRCAHKSEADMCAYPNAFWNNLLEFLPCLVFQYEASPLPQLCQTTKLFGTGTATEIKSHIENALLARTCSEPLQRILEDWASEEHRKCSQAARGTFCAFRCPPHAYTRHAALLAKLDFSHVSQVSRHPFIMSRQGLSDGP